MLSLPRALGLAFALSLPALQGTSAMPSITLDVEGDSIGAQTLNPYGVSTPEDEDGVRQWELSQTTYLFDDLLDPLGLTDPLGEATAGITGWSAQLKEDPFVTNNINVTNTSGSNQVFIATVLLPIPAFDYDRVINSSVGITVTDSNGDGSLLLDEDGGTPIYQGTVDGSSLLDLTPGAVPLTLADCSPSVAGCSADDADGTPLLMVPAGTATEIGIILRFELSPGDSAGITSRFEIVPEPGTALLLGLGLASLSVGRRRRS